MATCHFWLCICSFNKKESCRLTGILPGRRQLQPPILWKILDSGLRPGSSYSPCTSDLSSLLLFLRWMVRVTSLELTWTSPRWGSSVNVCWPRRSNVNTFGFRFAAALYTRQVPSSAIAVHSVVMMRFGALTSIETMGPRRCIPRLDSSTSPPITIPLFCVTQACHTCTTSLALVMRLTSV
ncbi:MAG: hypothetical protein JWP06_160 [Candidatus Saccharibacteria bacterium]|nr:hypothetical protein [Candidatus Saccharibacteria bacterium]